MKSLLGSCGIRNDASRTPPTGILRIYAQERRARGLVKGCHTAGYSLPLLDLGHLHRNFLHALGRQRGRVVWGKDGEGEGEGGLVCRAGANRIKREAMSKRDSSITATNDLGGERCSPAGWLQARQPSPCPCSRTPRAGVVPPQGPHQPQPSPLQSTASIRERSSLLKAPPAPATIRPCGRSQPPTETPPDDRSQDRKPHDLSGRSCG